MMDLDTVYMEDCMLTMVDMEDCMVDMILTSPPYPGQRDYSECIVSDWDRFCALSTELYRVLSVGGVLVWVVADKVWAGSESGLSFKQVLRFKDVGFLLYDTMIYAKLNPMPNSNRRRYRQAFEYMFVLSKRVPAAFNPIMVPISRHDVGKQRERDGSLVRNSYRTRAESRKHDNIFFYGIGGGRSGHPAVFPLGLAIDQILSWSNENDIVYDPFMGSGTVAKASILTNRRFIGSELRHAYEPIIANTLDSI